jgi:peptidoglycan/LPS O-acetylase OafA/YrhL
MEGLRGCAVFLVFLVHYVTLIDPWITKHSALHSIAGALHAIGNTGVDLFFVLSGYLIYGSLISRPQNFMRFMLRRVERIYPTFVVVFMVYVALSFVLPEQSKIPSSVFTGTMYLIQNFLLLPGIFPIKPIITVAWSLSYEMFYYLAIPLVIVAFRLRRRSALWRVSFFATVAAAIIIYCAAYEGHIRLIMFVSGIFVYEAIKGRLIPIPGSALALSAVAIGMLTTLLPVAGPGEYTLKISILFVSLSVLCLSCFGQSGGRLASMLSWAPLRWFGNMSYSYYLLHGLALKAGFLALAGFAPVVERGPLFFWALMPAMFAWTLIPTSLLFLLVERPFSLTPRHARTESRESSSTLHP